MGRFTKRLIGGLAAALTLAGGAAAGQFLVADFDDGSNQHNLGYYYYSFGAGTKESCNEPERALVISAGPADEYGPMSYKAQSPEAECHSGSYCGALIVKDIPASIGSPDNYYPSFGFGMSLTKNDETGYGADFNKVDSIAFWAMTESPGVSVMFKVETIRNSMLPPYGEGMDNTLGCTFPVEKSNKSLNAYFATFEPTGEWKRYVFYINDFDPGKTGPIPTNAAMPISMVMGDKFQQGGYWGEWAPFKRDEVTKLAWQINSDKNDAANGKTTMSVFIDDIVLIGSQVTDKFYTPAWECTGCVGSPTGNKKVLSTFEGDDALSETNNYLRNSLGHYWYWYDDKVGGGSSTVKTTGLIENPNVSGQMIMNTQGKGVEGGRGAYITFETGGAFIDPAKGASVPAFVGIGANLYDSSDVPASYFDGSGYTGLYFTYKTSSDVAKVNVELTDACDAATLPGGKPVADDDGEVLFTQIPGTNEQWVTVAIPFTKFVQPGWVVTNGKRRGPEDKGSCGATLKLAQLAQVKFKIDASYLEGELQIDDVGFYAGGVGVKYAHNRAASSTGLRAAYNRGVVGVNWAAEQNIASGKVSLVNVRGRTVASAPLVKAGNKVTANLGKGNIPTGMYFVRVNAKDAQGKKIVQQVPLSIVK